MLVDVVIVVRKREREDILPEIRYSLELTQKDPAVLL